MKNMKKLVCSFAVLSMALSSFVLPSKYMVLEAARTDEVTVTKSGSTYTIGNAFIERSFDTSGDKVKTKNVTNYRTDNSETVLTPENGTEEFVISLMAPKIPSLSTSGWSADADSYQTNEKDGDGPASNLIDGNENTIWHSRYNSSGLKGDQSFPHNVIISFGKNETFQAFAYVGRSNGTNGHIKNYELYANTESSDLDYSSTGWKLVKKGTFDYAEGNTNYVNLDQAWTARQIKLVAVDEVENRSFASGAELYFYANPISKVSSTIKASDLTLDGAPVEADIDGGKQLTFKYKTTNVNGVDYSIEEVVTMYDGESFMRKHLNINVPMDQADSARIDYIDLENMNFSDSDLKQNEFWTIPEQSNNPDMANMSGDLLELGQPYYVAATYWGSEFPETENKIREGNGYIRYWYGKSLAKDEYFEYNMNNQAGSMTTWPAVVGAARSRDYSVCQSDFYEYIETIATPTQFRQQFNTWYDYMKDITAENIRESFYEVEKGFTQYGVNPLDSYVVDDGWIDYSSFWQFNNKFPNELYDSSLQVEQMGSNFGLWLGPRGGYGTQTQIANWIANAGEGSVNKNSGNDINISDARYLNKLLDDIFVNYQEKFHINYWKLDGMLLNPSTTVTPYHVTGNKYYTFSETYERWTDMWETMREHEAIEDDLWINVTSYLNPSPWYLQWANSVWMQNTGDVGYTQKFGANDSQQALTYRDNCYYNFVNTRQWQMPMKYFYNHDPVYGSTAHIGPGKPNQIYFSTDGMREYLYMLGTRGTAFWEYYYSPSMFDDEKWQVNAEAANWIEDNFDILQKSKMFGGQPANGDVYGYSCWNGNEGIVSIRNPHNTTKTYTLTYDRLVGVTEGIKNLYGQVVIGDIKWQNDEEMYYGKEVTYTLQPFETLIMYYGEKDTTAAKVESMHGEGNKLEVTFNETIREADVNDIEVEGYTVTTATLNADKRTVTLTLSKALEDAADITINVKGIQDVAGNTSTETVCDDYYENGLINSVVNVTTDGTAIEKGNKYSIDGTKDFTITGVLTTSDKGAEIVSQEDAYKLSIDEEGYLVFEFNGMSVNSKYEQRTIQSDKSVKSEIKGMIADGKTHQFSAVKEANGMIKIYLDGTVVASTYDETKVNPVVTKGNVVVANGLSADIAYLTLMDDGLAFDEVAALSVEEPTTNAENVMLASNNAKVRITAWQNDGVPTQISEKNEGQTRFSNINNGNKDSDFYLELTDTNNGKNQSRYIEVDLGDTYALTKLNMTRYYKDSRTYGATVIAVSETADFANKTIVYNSDTNNVHGLGAGKDATYQETSSGKDFVLSSTTNARYIRVYVYGRDGSTSDHIVELEAYAKAASTPTDAPAKDRGDESIEIVKPVDKAELELALVSAEAIMNSGKVYTAETLAALNLAYLNASEVMNNVDATQEDVDATVDELLAAIENMVEVAAPEKVTGLKATDKAYNKVALTWNVSEGAVEYDVYQKAHDSEKFEFVATVSEAEYTATVPMTGKENKFYVVAKNEAGEADASEVVAMATTLHGTVKLNMKKVSTAKFELSWNKIAGATRYIIYSKRGTDEWKKVLTLGKDKLSYVTAELPNGEYSYIIRAARYDSSDRVMTAKSNAKTGTVEAIAPTVSVKVSGTKATLTWNKLEGVTYYQVLRKTSKEGKYTVVKTTSAQKYTANVSKTKTYYFKVRGYKAYKSGANSKYNVYTPYSAAKAVKGK